MSDLEQRARGIVRLAGRRGYVEDEIVRGFMALLGEQRVDSAEEIAAAIEAACLDPVWHGECAHKVHAALARELRVPDCGHEYHGADGGRCPGCGFDVARIGPSRVGEEAQR